MVVQSIEPEQAPRPLEETLAGLTPKLLCTLDVAYAIAIFLTSGRPWLTLALGLALPALNVPAVVLGLRHGRRYMMGTLSISVLLLFVITWQAGPGAPGWLVGTSLIAATLLISRAPLRFQAGLIGATVVAAVAGSYMAGASTYALLAAGGVLSALGIVGLPAVSLLLEQSRQLSLLEARARVAVVAKTRFIANISHELRTPMNGVLGMLAVLSISELSRSQRRSLSTAERSAGKLMQILDALIDYSQLKAGDISLEAAPCHPEQLVHDVVQRLEDTGATASTPIAVQATDRVPAVLTIDGERLRQIISSLAENALKFTPGGRITVNLDVEETSPTGGTLVLEIVDTGLGISDSTTDRIFRPFEQADGSETRAIGGVGLGLPLVRELVTLMDGRLRLTSVEGRGSTFRVELPFTAADPASLDPLGERLLISANGVRILVVDDVETNRELCRHWLSQVGADVEVAAGGAEAVAMHRQFGYDLVLMDWQMPRMDGCEAARQIRQDESVGDKHVPIVAMTAAPPAEARRKCFLAGMDEFVRKPATAEGLYAAVLDLLPDRVKHGPRSSVPASRLNRESEARLLRMCIRGTAGRLDKLNAAIEAKAWTEVKRLAHSVRGGCGALATPDILELTMALESLSEHADAEGVGETFSKLESRFAEARAAALRRAA